MTTGGLEPDHAEALASLEALPSPADFSPTMTLHSLTLSLPPLLHAWGFLSQTAAAALEQTDELAARAPLTPGDFSTMLRHLHWPLLTLKKLDALHESTNAGTSHQALGWVQTPPVKCRKCRTPPSFMKSRHEHGQKGWSSNSIDNGKTAEDEGSSGMNNHGMNRGAVEKLHRQLETAIRQWQASYR